LSEINSIDGPNRLSDLEYVTVFVFVESLIYCLVVTVRNLEKMLKEPEDWFAEWVERHQRVPMDQIPLL